MRDIWGRHLLRRLPEPTPEFVERWERTVARSLKVWQGRNAQHAVWPYPERAARKARAAYERMTRLFRLRDAITDGR